jgi:hypothetical protein
LARHDLWLPGERQQFATAGIIARRPPDEIASRNAQIESPLSGANLKTFFVLSFSGFDSRLPLPGKFAAMHDARGFIDRRFQ